VPDETQLQILTLLDTLAIEVAESRLELRGEMASLHTDMRTGLERVDRRLGNLETRVETIETEQRSFRREFERRVAPVER
jgi:hypothetical protein